MSIERRIATLRSCLAASCQPRWTTSRSRREGFQRAGRGRKEGSGADEVPTSRTPCRDARISIVVRAVPHSRHDAGRLSASQRSRSPTAEASAARNLRDMGRRQHRQGRPGNGDSDSRVHQDVPRTYAEGEHPLILETFRPNQGARLSSQPALAFRTEAPLIGSLWWRLAPSPQEDRQTVYHPAPGNGRECPLLHAEYDRSNACRRRRGPRRGSPVQSHKSR